MLVWTYSSCEERQHLVCDLVVAELVGLDDAGEYVVLSYVAGLLEIGLLLFDDVGADATQVATNLVESCILLERQDANEPFWDRKVQAQEDETSNIGAKQLEKGVGDGV